MNTLTYTLLNWYDIINTIVESSKRTLLGKEKRHTILGICGVSH